MKKTSVLSGCLLVTVLLLVSCIRSSEVSQTSTPTLRASSIPTEVAATGEATRTVNLTVEARFATVYANRTEAASYTATPQQPTRTPEPTWKPIITATPLSEEEASKQKILTEYGIDLDNLEASPNKRVARIARESDLQEVIDHQFDDMLEKGFITAIVVDLEWPETLDEAVKFPEAGRVFKNKSGEGEIIRTPLEAYNNGIAWNASGGMGEKTEDRINLLLSVIDKENTFLGFESLFSVAYGEDITFKPGAIVRLLVIYPTTGYEKNNTKGLDFNSGLYTAEDLDNFRKTGDGEFLTQVNGQDWFWPCVKIDNASPQYNSDELR